MKRMKNSAAVLGLVAFFCTLAVGCEVAGTGEEDLPQHLQPGPYAFTAYDSLGTAIVKGTLNFNAPRDSGWDLEGTWEFEEVQEISSRLEARMTGQGPLRGRVQKDGGVRINLNPELEDAESVLRGSSEKDGLLEGEWAITDWGMETAGGRFEARPE